jgi:hypothetical protein
LVSAASAAAVTWTVVVTGFRAPTPAPAAIAGALVETGADILDVVAAAVKGFTASAVGAGPLLAISGPEEARRPRVFCAKVDWETSPEAVIETTRRRRL